VADTLTTNYQWIMPEDQASNATWGQKINGDLQAIDGVVFANQQAVTAQLSPGLLNWSNSLAPSGQQVRWDMSLITTEAASNVGSDLAIHRFDNTGAPFASGGGGPSLHPFPSLAAGVPVMSINRATGSATFNAPTQFVGGATLVGAYGLNLNGSFIQFFNSDATVKYGLINSFSSGGQFGVQIQSSATNPVTSLIVGADGSGRNGIIANGSLLFTGGNSIGFGVASSGATIARIAWTPINQFPLPPTAGTFTISSGGSTLTLDNTANFTFSGSGNAYKPGGGAWAALSDARIKTEIGDYSFGLEQVLQLRPVEYRYKGNDGEAHPTDKQHVGLIAQEAEQVMPGMVTLCEGTIDGEAVSDLRRLDTSELIFALVNSVKELTARIRVLEGR
jgi:hypothetical protein